MGLMELFVEEASLRIHVIELRYFTRPCIFKKKKHMTNIVANVFFDTLQKKV